MERHWLVLFILVAIRLALAQTDVSTDSSVSSEAFEAEVSKSTDKVTDKVEVPPSSESESSDDAEKDTPSIYLFRAPSSIKTSQKVKVPESSSEYALPWNAHTTEEISTNFPGTTESTTASVSWFQRQQEQHRLQQQLREQQRIQQQQRLQQQQKEQQIIQQQQREQQKIQQQQKEQIEVQPSVYEQQRVQQTHKEPQIQVQPSIQEQQKIQQQQKEPQIEIQPSIQEQQRIQQQEKDTQIQVQPSIQEQEKITQQQKEPQIQVQPSIQEQQRIQVQQKEQIPQQQEKIPQYQPQVQEQQQQQVQVQEQQRIQQQQKQEQVYPYQQHRGQQYQHRVQALQQQQRVQQQQRFQQVQQQNRQPFEQGFSNIKQFKASSVKTVPVQQTEKVSETNDVVEEPKGKVPFQNQPNDEERFQKADVALNEYFSDVLANLSVKMKTGMDEPVGEILDPVRLDDMQLQPLVAGEIFDVKMKKISVSGLSDYRVTQLESQLSDSRIKVGIHYPKLSANCIFGANGTMYEIFKVTGRGNATIIFNEVHARTVLYLTKDNGVLQVTSADQPYVDFSSAEILFRDEDAPEDVEPVKAESVATQLGPLYFWVLTANAVDKIDYPLAEYFNKALKEFPLSDFLSNQTFRQRHLRIHVPSHPIPYAYVASDLAK